MVERLPEHEVARILATRRRAWTESLDLLSWADEIRTRPDSVGGPGATLAGPMALAQPLP